MLGLCLLSGRFSAGLWPGTRAVPGFPGGSLLAAESMLDRSVRTRFLGALRLRQKCGPSGEPQVSGIHPVDFQTEGYDLLVGVR